MANQVTKSKENLYLKIDEKLVQYGVQSTSNIDIDAEEVMNDLELPRRASDEE